MSLIDGLLGNASEIDIAEIQERFGEILITGEQVEKAYRLIRDLMIFTNKRLILVDKQGITGNKVELHSIPYSKISHFSVETAGTLDLEAELKIWVTGYTGAIQRTFNRGLNIFTVEKVLASYVLK